MPNDVAEEALSLSPLLSSPEREQTLVPRAIVTYARMEACAQHETEGKHSGWTLVVGQGYGPVRAWREKTHVARGPTVHRPPLSAPYP